MNYMMIIAYDGTDFGGWQIQPNSRTIQEVIEEKLFILLRKPVKIIGSGRTDAGVHARAQVANFHYDAPLSLDKTIRSLNGLLPKTIRIRSISIVDENFHARFSATGKIYHYHLAIDPIILPFDRLYRYHPYCKIDIEKIKEAAAYFLGRHDFTSFANLGGSDKNPIKTLKKLEIIPEEGGLLLHFEGDGFLYKMVRNIVGTLIDCASGKLKPSHIPLIFEAKDRKKAPAAAPPEGLFLYQVLYSSTNSENIFLIPSCQG